MKYLKLFEKQTDYQSFIESDQFVTPNVSLVKEEDIVFYNPYKENPSLPNNIITYQSDSKLKEVTTDSIITGFHVKNFNSPIVSHEFADGIGTITFKKDVTSIGKYAFSGCTSLTSIEIPDSVTTIGDDAFYKCSGLTSIIIPDSVTGIGSNAFYNCSSLTGELVIPDSVTGIGEYAFYGCSGLTSIVIPDSVTGIGSNAFSRCTSLTSVVIPNSETSIASYMFSNCTGLTSIDIPDSVTRIQASAFLNCSELTSITCRATTAPTISSDAFRNVKTNGILYVPAGSDYSSWMSTSSYYLGKYNWTIQEI